MTLFRTATIILDQLADLLSKLETRDFGRPSQTLGGSSIGKHVRHTLEFFRCFQSGYAEGWVNYDNRSHDTLMEHDKGVALEAIDEIRSFLSTVTEDKHLQLLTGLDPASDRHEWVGTTVRRELVYNIEHAVHHMAIIRIGLREIAPGLVLQKDFGVAASTVRHTDRVQPAK